MIFILATTEVHKLPATILSRCQRFDFHRISPDAIRARLSYVAEQEGATITDDAARLIAAVADGAMRDALSLMDRCLGSTRNIATDDVRLAAGLAKKDYLFELANACINKNTAKALELIAKLHSESKDMARLCDELIDHFRSLMMIKTTRHPRDLIVMSDDEFEDAQTQSDYLTLGEIVYMMDTLQNAYKRMGKGNSNKTELEMALVRLSSPELEGTNEALTARLSALEKAVKSGVTVVTQTVETEKPKQEEKPKPVVEEPPKAVEPPKAEPVKEQPKAVEPPKPESKPQQKAAEARPLPSALNMDELYANAKPFRQWPEVVENIMKYSKAIGSAFSNTNAYESGQYLLIDADSEIAFSLLRQSSQRENIRKAILEITGRTYKLGPYKKPEKKEEKNDPLASLISDLKERGVEVNEE